MKHSHFTTEHSEHPQEGIHLGYSKKTDHMPAICAWQSILASVAEVYRRKWFGCIFTCLFPGKWGRECTSHTYCMRLYPCNIPVNSGISLMIIGKGFYELNRTVNIGAASWGRIQMTIRINSEAEMNFLCNVLEWQEVNGSLKSNNTKLG